MKSDSATKEAQALKQLLLLEPTIMSTRKICDRKQQVVCPPQIYPSPKTESWVESSTASFPDVRADRGGVARPPGEVRDGWVGTSDDPKAPEPQTDATILFPSGVAPHPMKGRVGGEKEHELSHVGATALP